MRDAGVKSIILAHLQQFGDPQSRSYYEDSPSRGTTNPYGTSKYIVERILSDLFVADESGLLVYYVTLTQ